MINHLLFVIKCTVLQKLINLIFMNIGVCFDLRSLFYDDLDKWWTSTQDMIVEHSSVNGSIKINKERGYQKLPRDQEIHVIKSKKSPVEKTKRALIWRVKRHM